MSPLSLQDEFQDLDIYNSKIKYRETEYGTGSKQSQ